MTSHVETCGTFDSDARVLVLVEVFYDDALPVGQITDLPQVREGLLWGAWMSFYSRQHITWNDR